MEDSSTIIILLTINTVLLSLVVVVFLVAVTILIIRVNRTVKHIEDIAENVSSITDWFTPTKLVASLIDMFKK